MAKTAQRPTRKQLKAAIKAASYSERIAWWVEQSRLGTLPPAECEAEVRSIEKRLAKIANEVPSETWHEDVRRIAPTKGGAWPCPGMIRARGERRIYPPSYITTSGYSYDVYMQDVYAGGRQHLLDDDGYMGSTVRIGDLPKQDQERIRRREKFIREHGKYRTMTGIL